MSFEGPKEPLKIPEHLKKGMMEAGQVFFQDISEQRSMDKRAGASGSREVAGIKESVTDLYFPKMVKHDERLAERAAFNSMVDESGLWQELAQKKLGNQEIERLKAITGEYLKGYRNPHSDSREMKARCEELKQLIRSCN